MGPLRHGDPKLKHRATSRALPIAAIQVDSIPILILVLRTPLSRLPVASGTAAAGTSSSKATEASSAAAAISTAEATIAPPPAATQHVAEHEPEPAATTTTASGDDHDEDDDEESDAEDGEDVDAPPHWLAMIDLRLHRLRRAEGDAGVRGDVLGDLLQTTIDGRTVLRCLELRDHGTADIADLGIIQNAFQAIANLDPALVVVDGEEHDQPAVGGLGTDLPFFFELVSELRGGGAMQGVDGDHGNLRVGLGVHLVAEGLHLLFRCGVDDTGKVADVAGGFGKLVDGLLHIVRCLGGDPGPCGSGTQHSR